MSRRALRAASRSAKPASAAAWAARSPARLASSCGADGGVGRVGGGDERVGGLAGGAQRGVQVGLAVELGQQRLAVPSGAQVGLGGLAQAGFALFGQLGEVFPGVGDGLVESLERGLEVGVPGRRGGQFRSPRPPLTGGRLEPGRVGLERDQVRGDGEAVALEPGG